MVDLTRPESIKTYSCNKGVWGRMVKWLASLGCTACTRYQLQIPLVPKINKLLEGGLSAYRALLLLLQRVSANLKFHKSTSLVCRCCMNHTFVYAIPFSIHLTFADMLR